MNSQYRREIVLAIVTMVFPFALSGCSSGEYKLVPVSGTVTLDGKPVAGARVIFEPQRSNAQALTAGPGSDGKTNEEGRYSLATTADARPGAIAGTHAVVITTFQAKLDRTRDSSTVVRDEEIPLRYRDGSLTYDVPAEGSSTADFALQSKP